MTDNTSRPAATDPPAEVTSRWSSKIKESLPPDCVMTMEDGDVTLSFGTDCTLQEIKDLLYLMITGQLYLTGTLRAHVSQAGDEWSPRVPVSSAED